jgi:hypothetical protein
MPVMAFLTLDDKNECIGYYLDGKLVFDEDPCKENISHTWKYHPSLKNKDIQYANLYVDGKDFAEVCPEHLKDEWHRLSTMAKSLIRSFIEAKVSLKENCFYDLVPKKFLINYSQIKCEITEHIINTVEKPHDYQFRLDLERLLVDIKFNKLNLDFQQLKNQQHEQKTRDFNNKYSIKDNTIVYNQFHSKTGRLTTEENSFPVLTMNKDFRKIIQPTNDFFIDIDYNAAEVRTFLALCGEKQPDIDIHEWNMEKFGFEDRTDAKNNFISWLYGKKNKKEKEFKQIYKTHLIKEKYWNGTQITNYYGKKILSDEFHAINYVIQSTTAGLVLRQAIAVHKLLQNYKSKIIMIIHDNIILDIKKEEKHIIQSIVDLYNNTEFGKFKASVKIGKNLSEMRKLS